MGKRKQFENKVVKKELPTFTPKEVDYLLAGILNLPTNGVTIQNVGNLKGVMADLSALLEKLQAMKSSM